MRVAKATLGLLEERGGIIILSSQNINFTGTIQSNGANGTTAPYGRISGGGSGGSIRIEGSAITLDSATVNVSGGGGGIAGGLGRVAVYYYNSFTHNSNFTPGYQNQLSLYVTPSPTVTATPPTSSTNPGTNGLAAWWSMNETSGIRNDSHGTNHLTDNNTVGYAAGVKSNAANFIAANTEYLSRADPFTIGQMTIGAWVKPTDTATVYTIIAKYGAAGTREFVMSYDASGFYCTGSSDGATPVSVSTGSPSGGSWFFVVCQYNGSNLSISVNNGALASTALAGIFNGTSPFMIGYRSTNNFPMYGDIDEAFYYSRALSADEREYLYNSGAGRAYCEVAGTCPTPTPLPTGWQSRTYAYDANHPHAVASLNQNAAPIANYTYDSNGNMTCRTENGVTYLQTYNTENRISSIIKLASGTCAAPGPFLTKWDFAYDGDGVRVSTLTTPYDENGEPLTPESTSYFFGGAYETRSDDTTIKYYSFAGQTIAMDDGTGLQYFLTDHLGSVVATTDSYGTLTSQQRYLPFGGVRPNVPSPDAPATDYGYTGQRNLDSGIGLMDYKARFYSPYITHFSQPDTIVPNLYNSQSLNRYSYVSNRPVNFNDPTGHEPHTPGSCYESVNGVCGYTSYENPSVLLKKSPKGGGNRGSRSSGDGGSENQNDPPSSADPGLKILPLREECPEEYSLVQCAYSGGYYQPYGNIEMDNDEFNQLLLAIFFDLKNRKPVGGYDFANRSIYDTPLWDGYGAYTGNVCFDDECYKRSEVNYVAQGMWVAASGQSQLEGEAGVLAWKVCSFVDICRRDLTANYWPPTPSDGTLYWLDAGYNTYNALNESYPYP